MSKVKDLLDAVRQTITTKNGGRPHVVAEEILVNLTRMINENWELCGDQATSLMDVVAEMVRYKKTSRFEAVQVAAWVNSCKQPRRTDE